jgi:hypothetical protein
MVYAFTRAPDPPDIVDVSVAGVAWIWDLEAKPTFARKWKFLKKEKKLKRIKKATPASFFFFLVKKTTAKFFFLRWGVDLF